MSEKVTLVHFEQSYQAEWQSPEDHVRLIAVYEWPDDPAWSSYYLLIPAPQEIIACHMDWEIEGKHYIPIAHKQHGRYTTSPLIAMEWFQEAKEYPERFFW